ncbi:MAG: cell division protein FtsA [Candidatus Zambryskibacteria bacterium]|nr:cell division protein FtsA [Candidatus Zambryskibacteria bacterium]
MARQIVVGIDIGTFETKVIIAQGAIVDGHFTPKIIGTGTAESKGVEHGYITNISEAAHALSSAVAKAERIAGIKARRAYVAFGGLGLGGLSATGSVAISRADLEITERDLALAMEQAEKNIPAVASLNRRIINSIPVEYKIDGKISWGEPLGLKAQRIEVKALFITCMEHHLSDLIKTVEEAGIEVIDVVAAPVAAGFVTVSKKQRRVGCLLADLGAETLSVMAFENNNPVSLEVFPVGSEDITNDIALGLKILLEEAENIKLGGLARLSYSKKKLEEIIALRLKDCFELIESHLKKIGRDSLLPAGIILMGGGAGTAGIKHFAEEVLGLPAQVAEVHLGGSDKNKIRDSIWAVSCGLVLVGFNANNEEQFIGRRGRALSAEGGQRLMRRFSRWVSQFLP